MLYSDVWVLNLILLVSYFIIIVAPVAVVWLQNKKIKNYIKKECEQLKRWYELQNYERLIQETQSALIRNYLFLNKLHASVFCGDFVEAERTMRLIKIKPYMLSLFSLKQLCIFFFYAFQSNKPKAMKARKGVCAELSTKQYMLRYLVNGISAFMEGKNAESINLLYKFIQQSRADEFYLPCAYYYLGRMAQGQGRIADQKKYYTLLQQADPHNIFYQWALKWGDMK